jgi:hypothetical protein
MSVTIGDQLRHTLTRRQSTYVAAGFAANNPSGSALPVDVASGDLNLASASYQNSRQWDSKP